MKKFIALFILFTSSISLADFSYTGASSINLDWDMNQTQTTPSISLNFKYNGGSTALNPSISGLNASAFKIGVDRCSGKTSKTCSISITLNRITTSGTYLANLNLQNSSPTQISLSSIVSTISQSNNSGGSSITGEFSPSNDQVINFTTSSVQKEVLNLTFKNTSSQSFSPILELNPQSAYSKVLINRCSVLLKSGNSCSISIVISKPPMNGSFNQSILIKNGTDLVRSLNLSVITNSNNVSCPNGQFWNGFSCQNIIYQPSFSTYTPVQSSLQPCQGQVVATRTISSCFRVDNSEVVSTSLCVDPTPTQLISSPGGTIIESISNGSQTVQCNFGSSIKNVVSRTCNNGFIDNGTDCVSSGYTATYSSYSPDPSSVVSCQGSVVSSRSILTCQRDSDNAIVSNSFCTDSTPSITTQSPAGQESVSILNGTQVNSCASGSSIRVFVSRTCQSGYFDNGSGCSLITYQPTFSSYQPDIGSIQSCEGTVISSRNISSCMRVDNSQIVPNALCLDLNPTVSTQSPAGSITVSISHGSEQRYCALGSTQYSVQSRSCDNGYLNNGTGCSQNFTYTANYSAYSPDTSSLTPCQGSIVSSRTIIWCTRDQDGSLVSNSLCVDPSPTTISNSPSGVISVSITNGSQQRSCQAGSSLYTVQSTTCDNGYHAENNSCVADTQSCSIANGTGTKTWNGSAYSACLVSSCDNGYFVFENSCESTTRTCYTRYGQGTQTYNGTDFGFCENLTCDSGSYKVGDDCFPNQKIVMSSSNTGFIGSDQKIYIGGLNTTGIIGDNSTVSRSGPVSPITSGVLSGKVFKDLSIGNTHTCSLSTDNKVFCWGSNTGGTLGNNSFTSSFLSPVEATTSGTFLTETFKKIQVANAGSCVLAVSGNLYCWGNSYYNGSLASARRVPTLVNSSTSSIGTIPIKDVVSFGLGFCALTNLQQVYCWGNNTYGGLGNNYATTTPSEIPVLIGDSSTSTYFSKKIYRIFGGTRGVCALDTANKIYCWGHYDLAGDLYTVARMPVEISLATNTYGTMQNKLVKTLALGDQFICASTIPTGLTCWGDNHPTYNNFGVNVTIPRYNTNPVDVNLSSVITDHNLNYQTPFSLLDFTVGSIHAGFLTSVGNVFTWGDNTNFKAVLGFGQTVRTTPGNIPCYGSTVCY